jgi:hypothetical protein
MALYAAGGGFGGALLAIVIAKILAGPCCCEPTAMTPDVQPERKAASVLTLERVQRVSGVRHRYSDPPV